MEESFVHSGLPLFGEAVEQLTMHAGVPGGDLDHAALASAGALHPGSPGFGPHECAQVPDLRNTSRRAGQSISAAGGGSVNFMPALRRYSMSTDTQPRLMASFRASTGLPPRSRTC